MAAGSVRKISLRFGLDCARGVEGEWKTVAVVSGTPEEDPAEKVLRTWITLDLELGGTSRAVEKGVREIRTDAIPKGAPVEKASVTGDPGTLRRRLELVLGGPPGFTTGARAEMLSDLLREFGTPKVLEAIAADWITQFDTGIESSPSVG